jgi:hypothetical protein
MQQVAGIDPSLMGKYWLNGLKVRKIQVTERLHIVIIALSRCPLTASWRHFRDYSGFWK